MADPGADAPAVPAALSASEWRAWRSRRAHILRAGVAASPTGPAGADAPAAVVTAFRVQRDHPSTDAVDEGTSDETHTVTQRGLTISGDHPAMVDVANLPALMALANDRLPDSAPGKLTAAHYHAALAGAVLAREHGLDGLDGLDGLAAWLDDTAAKLRALLPPEGP